MKVIPDAKAGSIINFQYISDESLSFPDMAYETLRKESQRLYNHSLLEIPSIF